MRLRDIFYATCVVLGTLLLAYVLYELADLIVVIFVALIFASTVRPILRGMTRRHIPQWLSILIIYAGTALGLVGLILLAVPPIVTLMMDVFQNNSLINTMSYSLMRSGLALQRQFDIFIPVLSLPAQFRAFTDMADQTIKEQAVPFASNAFYVLGQIVLAVVISV